MKIFVYTILLANLMVACQVWDNELECEYSEPTQELSWLKEIKENLEKRMGPAGAQIIQYEYNGAYVFMVDDCYHCADAITVVYNCKGDTLCVFGGIAGFNTCPDFNEKSSDKTILYSSMQQLK